MPGTPAGAPARKTPSDTSDAAIVRKLRAKAARGDVAAARGLREHERLRNGSHQFA
jgi:hypothetical protein